MSDQPKPGITPGRASVLLLIPGVGLVVLGLALQLFIDTTPPGGSGEFQGINHFAPGLLLMLVCVPGTLLVGMVGLGARVKASRDSVARNPHVVGATVIHATICVAWMVRFLRPLIDVILH